jgi:hypothetical protein
VARGRKVVADDVVFQMILAALWVDLWEGEGWLWTRLVSKGELLYLYLMMEFSHLSWVYLIELTKEWCGDGTAEDSGGLHLSY